MSSAAEEDLVGRCYTKARRHPSMIGQWEGRRLWGGPYSVPQFITMGVVFAVMIVALVAVPSLWSTFGLFNLVALALVPYLASLLVRRLHIDGRHPFAALASAAGLVAGGQRPRLGGRQLRRITTQPLQGTVTLTAQAPKRRAAASAVPSEMHVLVRRPSRRATTTPVGTASTALAQLATHRSSASREQR
ncbi:phage holin family protein [Streptomyces sp. NBC_01445]|uniref:phage holin family protein n=1 Tax=Streptomyces sp. NBC_01445 TaxID=2903869 RepID=UPI002DD7A979|nr:phage holin family protein [Streptomyces sp. NBC_01445]WSE02003.1 phage holin family protein [Streptomyces sp. NBC_01445]WSE10327.1 phage holin family protein [Streptomyces sp. NBC_01445]WSE11105.1 phage holin family protein [Streptomyces sp. NBC_01445]